MAYGTAYIFERRARRQRRWLRGLSFLGIAVPAALGWLVLAAYGNPQQLHAAINIAAFIGLIQLVGTIWSLVAKWDDNLAYSLEAKSVNYRLADEFYNLSKKTTLTREEFETEKKVIEAEAKIRSGLDEKYDLSHREKSRGMRAALWKYQRACATCKDVPKSMKPKKSDKKCDTCGNF